MIDPLVLQQCQQKDRRAQRQLYQYLLPKIYHTCKRYIDNSVDIEDVIAEIFVLIFTKIYQLEHQEALVAWSKKIAIHHCLAFLKKHKQLEELTEKEMANQLTPAFSHDKDIMQLVSNLPSNSKIVFNLAVVEGYSHKEIAQLLQISEGTSKSQLNYAKNKLKIWIQELNVL